jgi:hypothetical protein
MTIARELFPDDESSYVLIDGTGIKQMPIERITPSLFLIQFRGACICVTEAWINRVDFKGLERKAFALRRYLRRSAAHNRKVRWADKPGAFSGDAGGR